MVNRYTRLRLRRNLRHKQRKIEQAGTQAGKHIDKLVIGRWRNLRDVRRFVIGWLLLVALLVGGVFIQSRDLSAYYQTDIPVAGGSFREGIVGNVTNMNPIYATSPVDTAAAKLMFSSLLKYDDENRLTGDLANDWKVNKAGNIYTVWLKPDLKWHDGEPLTAEDIVFTYELIQTPDTQSYLNESWRGIKVQAKNEHAVTFALPNPFTPFPHSLTQGGILPRHILESVKPDQLRGHTFNVSNPVGSGPFAFSKITEVGEERQIWTSAFDQYHFGRPKIDQFIIQTFSDYERMIQTFNDGEIVAMAGLRTIDRDLLEHNTNHNWHDVPLNNGMYVFMNNSNNLLKDRAVRKALTHATNRSAILERLEGRFLSAEGPLLKGQLGYKERFTQYDFSLPKARDELNKAGWKMSPSGVRKKGKNSLELRLVTQNSDDYPLIAETLQSQWARVGVRLDVNLVGADQIQQNHIVPHNYQMLLFGIIIGSDPDVYPYWHSSEKGVGRFNLSEYDNPTADIALEAGRTRTGKKLREAKYKTFLQEWRHDAPAVTLYQPGYGYVQHEQVNGFNVELLSTPDDRFNNVHTWLIQTRAGDKTY